MRAQSRAAAIWLLALAGLLVAGAAQASTLFGLVNTGELFASTDQGATWAVRATLPVRDAVAISAGASSSQLYLASASGTVYRSTDAGMGWSGVGAVPASDVTDLIVLPDLSVLLLTVGGTIYRSTDQGGSFTALAALTGSDFAGLALAVDGARLYALTRTGEIYESADGGSNWMGKGTVVVSDAAGLCCFSTALYLLTSAGDLYVSTDDASSWLAVGTLSQVGMTSLVTDQGLLIAGAGTGEVATSPDGASWSWRGAINQMTVRNLGTDTPATAAVPSGGTQADLSVSAPWPNPVRRGEGISIDLQLPADRWVAVSLYDVGGRRVVGLPAAKYAAGRQRLEFDAAVRAAGICFVRIRTESGQQANRTLVVLP